MNRLEECYKKLGGIFPTQMATFTYKGFICTKEMFKLIKKRELRNASK